MKPPFTTPPNTARETATGPITGDVFAPDASELELDYGGWFVPGRIHWLSRDPPIYGVSEWDESGEMLFERLLLFSPCKPQPHFDRPVSETDFNYGPDGVWAAGRHLYFRNRRVGAIDFEGSHALRDSGPLVAFAPVELP